MELPILYEDANVVAVAKPAGLLTHADARSSGPTAEDWFKEKYLADTDEGSVTGTGYVHRLDRDTSGVLVFAKNKAAYDFLRKAFHDREVKKTYLALTYGVPKERECVIDFDIGRSRRDFRLRSAQPKAKGRLRESLTRYEVIGEAKGTDKRSASGYALLKVTPETGRTHQIRVHLKAIHHPIVGDALYATGFFKSEMKSLGISRLGLHAYMLDLPLPSGGRSLVIAPIPDDLAPAFAHFPGASEKFALPRGA